MLEKKLQEELNRYKAINKYAKKMIMEQEAPLPPLPPAEDAAAAPEIPAGDVAPDPAVGMDTPSPDTTVDPSAGMEEPSMDSTEEIDITDLVNITKSLKTDIEDSKNQHGDVLSKMDDMFSKLDSLASQIGQMDNIIAKIDQLGAKVEEMKPETPQEKLEMRSLDSYPFNETPKDFFSHKQGEMKASGKNEYVLTKDEVDSYNLNTLRNTFNTDIDKYDGTTY